MLITVSGIVGSGKSTSCGVIISVLESTGQHARFVNFHLLACFTLLGAGAGARTRPAGALASGFSPRVKPRKNGGCRRLTSARAAVYLARIVAFRLYQLSWCPTHCHVSNRYFYDYFPHYQLTSSAERFWYALIRKLLPVPDLAILMRASLDTIAERRPSYCRKYLEQLQHGYDRLQADFPELQVVSTDPGDAAVDSVEPRLRSLVRSRLR